MSVFVTIFVVLVRVMRLDDESDGGHDIANDAAASVSADYEDCLDEYGEIDGVGYDDY